MKLKFKLTNESKVNLLGYTLFRIEATVDIPKKGVKKGDRGGWLESEQVGRYARVSGNAWVYGNAEVYGNARVSGDARVSGNALWWHIHHETLVEPKTEPIVNRRQYIREQKPKEEVKYRLAIIKKVKVKPKDYPKSKSGWEKLHKQECDCKWNGKTIFGKGWKTYTPAKSKLSKK